MVSKKFQQAILKSNNCKLITFVLLISSCFLFSFTLINRNVNLCAKKHFKLLNATSSSWTAGTARGGSGSEYYFKIIINSKQEIIFDSLWIGNRSSKIFITKEQKLVFNSSIVFTKGDTITLRTSFLNNNMKTAKKPLNIKGAALLSYRINDKLKYYSIKKIESQNPIYYP